MLVPSSALPLLATESRKEVPLAPLDYDNSITASGRPNTVAGCIAAKPAAVPFQSKQPRFAVLPRERHADVRLSSLRRCLRS